MSEQHGFWSPVARFFLVIVAIFAVVPSSYAVPSFARQTGEPCSACHTSYPGLTSFGRMFKLNGYTISAEKQVGQKASDSASGLSLNAIPNLSLILQVGETGVRKDVPGEKNPNANFPKEAGLYYAGRIADKVGAFLQLTYSAEDGNTGMDMSDIRYVTHATFAGKDTLLGIDLNNGPSFEDVWNSTPGYSWPYVENDAPATPEIPFMASDPVLTNVVGLGGYTYWNNQFYAYAGFYQAASQGNTPPSGDAVSGTAPYVRLAWTPVDNFEVGAFGFVAKYKPDSGNGAWSGPVEKYQDYGVDAQYQIVNANNTWTVHAREIHEIHSGLDNIAGLIGYTGNDSISADFMQVDVEYLYAYRYGASAGLFYNTGDRSTYYGLINSSNDGLGYRPNAKPETSGATMEVDYFPYENIRLSAQLTLYDKFHGSSSNYDGFGRSASDNDTLLVNALIGF